MGNKRGNELEHIKRTAVAAVCALVLTCLAGQVHAQNAAEKPPEKTNTHLTITAVGDIMMGSTHPVRKIPKDEGQSLFTGVREKLKDGDIVFGNLEGPLIDNGTPQKCSKESTRCYEFVTPTSYVNRLKEAGFTVLNVANNHIYDCGPEGIESTLSSLKGSGIAACGGNNETSLVIRGTKVAIACFSYRLSDHSYSILDLDTAGGIVARLKREHNIVIVSFHGGAEGKGATRTLDREEIFLGENRGNVVRFARTVIDSGADMVIGHGPHVLRAMEVYKGKLIAYSLGNFLTYKMFNVRGVSGISIILSARIDPKTGNFLGGEMVPVKLSADGVPAIDPKQQALSIINSLIARDTGQPRIAINEKGIITLPEKKLAQKEAD